MVYQNLKRGLDRAGIFYRDNDFRYIRQHPDELMCIIGKPDLVLEHNWPNPIIFGASVFDHPVDHPDFFDRYPNVKKLLGPGPWMYDMFAEHYPEERLAVWPIGIDVDTWKPAVSPSQKPDRILVYDKVFWDHDRHEQKLIQPIIQYLRTQGLTVETLRYGAYYPEDLQSALTRCRAVVFLCQHQTQGIAYQQMLASGVPLFAWDPGGYWPDPNYFPHRVRYEPVSSVPYWHERCGMKFETFEEFMDSFRPFWKGVQSSECAPRAYIEKNLSLEKCVRQYAHITSCVVSELSTPSV